MTANDMLRAEHARLRTQIQEFEKALTQNSPTLPALFAELQSALRAHFNKEDSVYYRIVDEKKEQGDRELMHTLRNDHAAVVFTLESLAIRLRKSPAMDDWSRRFHQMTAVLLPHFEREEKELFPRAEKLLSGEQLQSLLKEIQNLP